MMARRYAQGTTVTVEKTQAQLNKLLRTHGADGFKCGYHGTMQAIEFVFGALRFRISIDIPDHGSAEERRLWRALYAVIKAKLVAADDGISTVEAEFMAWVDTGNGQTLIERLGPQLENLRTTDTGHMLENLKIG